jgi:Tfp pilus assembly protein PilO
MDFKDPKNQILFLAIFGFLVLIYIWHLKFYTPYEEHLAQNKQLYAQLSSDLHAVKQKAESLEGLQKEVNEQNARYEKVKLWLPERKEDESFLAQLHIASQQTNSTVISIAPQLPTPQEFYTANSYIVEIESTYHNLGNLLAKIVNFPFIVNVSDIQIKAKEDKSEMQAMSAKKRKDMTVVATFKLTTYNSNNPDQGGQTQ